MPAGELAEPLYRIVLKMALALVFSGVMAIVVLLAVSFLKSWLTPVNAGAITTDVRYLKGELDALASIIIYCLLLLSTMYLIAGRDWKAFVEKMGLRLDRYGQRLFLTGALLASAAFVACIAVALLTGSLYYEDNEIRFTLMMMNGDAGIDNAGLIDNIPFLPMIISAAVFIILSLATAFGEEAFFRGYFQRSLAAKYGPFVAILAVSLSYVAIGIFLEASLLKIVDGFFFGVLLGYLYLMTGSLLVPVGFHFTIGFLMMESFQPAFYSSRLLYFYFNQPIKIAGISIGQGYYAISICISVILLIVLWVYSHNRRAKKENAGAEAPTAVN